MILEEYPRYDSFDGFHIISMGFSMAKKGGKSTGLKSGDSAVIATSVTPWAEKLSQMSMMMPQKRFASLMA
ncbi:MAG: hypothetical protein QXP38_04920, partial [Nitrososphaerota archaeon]